MRGAAARNDGKTTPRGFEPLRAEPNGFLVHLLSHSDKVSCLLGHSAFPGRLASTSCYLCRCGQLCHALRGPAQVRQRMGGFAGAISQSMAKRSQRGKQSSKPAHITLTSPRVARFNPSVLVPIWAPTRPRAPCRTARWCSTGRLAAWRSCAVESCKANRSQRRREDSLSANVL